MATNFTAKASSLREEFASEMKLRLSALAQVKSFGASSECDLLIGAGTAGTDSVFIRFTPIATVQKDVLGLAQQVFTPHIAQVVIEANPAGGAGADVGTWATRLAIIGSLIAKGIRVELYQVSNTTAVSSAGIAAGNLQASFEIHPQYPMMASI
jgi:hypothetical protein